MKLKLTLALLLVFVQPALAHPYLCSFDNSCRSYIGKRLWVLIPPGNPNVVELTFTQNDWTTSATLKLKTGASFLVKDLTKASVFPSDDYYVELSDGRRGWIGSGSPFLVDYDPIARTKQAAEECARRGPPKVGMTSTELTETCWRRPKNVVKRTTTSGVEELYVYGAGRTVRLVDGKVSEIIETR
ncbi:MULTISPECIES: hypothetical protein [unclassified Bradyrhizobium]|uniref:hypothetical protein n=1 Tax=Bradyrhizobium sp. USDA 4541 TaxID=2817704 RepID=UPI0020A47455|nr:hypothetical protein [Bradyrhizobium sp. USDA 4541]MCP1850283.1 hypothetical protein [Bradyrhizobium sp. USDA 4541]